MNAAQQIERFFEGDSFAVVGASADRSKYGNKVLRSYQQAGREVYAVNPNAEEVEGLTAHDRLADLPSKPHGVSIITPPAVTERIVREAIDAGIEHIWMQPGAESETAVRTAEAAVINVIADGSCVLVSQGFREAG